MLSIGDYKLFRVGDIVELSEARGRPNGVVIEIGEWGEIDVFWPATGKISSSAKQWAELHLSLVEEHH